MLAAFAPIMPSLVFRLRSSFLTGGCGSAFAVRRHVHRDMKGDFFYGRGRNRPISQYSDRELRFSFITGTVFAVALFAASFFFRSQSEWLCWFVRGFVMLWLAVVWIAFLGEIRRRKHNR